MAAPRSSAGAGGSRSARVKVVSVTATPSGRPRARSRRARRRAAKGGSGSAGVTGTRSASSGSVIAVLPSPFGVGGTERRPGANQQRRGGVQRTAEDRGDLGNRQVVHVPQGERGTVMRAQAAEHHPRRHGVDGLVPRVGRARLGL